MVNIATAICEMLGNKLGAKKNETNPKITINISFSVFALTSWILLAATKLNKYNNIPANAGVGINPIT